MRQILIISFISLMLFLAACNPCDLDQDGVLNEKEAAACKQDNGKTKSLDKCDIDGDGKISEKEKQACSGSGTITIEVDDDCDINKDGMIDEKEKAQCNTEEVIKPDEKPEMDNNSGSQTITSAAVEGMPITITSSGDLWMNTWADDNNIYTGWGDGSGFLGTGKDPQTVVDLGIAKLQGNLPNIVGTNIFTDTVLANVEGNPEGDVNDKPSSILFINGRLYAMLHSPLGDPNVGYLAYSDNYGSTWTRLKDSSPWTAHYLNSGDRSKTGSNFRCMFFINMGKNYELNTDGYVYAFGIGREWGWDGEVYLARVLKDEILDYNSYEYFSGMQGNLPQWSSSESNAQIVEGVTTMDQFSSIYHQGTGRYIILTSGNLYESPAPWGPWTLVSEWVRQGWSGYQPGIITKDAGADYFWFTIAGQPWIGNEITYNLNLGKMILNRGNANVDSAAVQKTTQGNKGDVKNTGTGGGSCGDGWCDKNTELNSCPQDCP